MKPGDLVVVQEGFPTSFLRIVGVDYMGRELHKTIHDGMMLSERHEKQIDKGTLCTVLEVREIDIRYVLKVTQATRRENFDWLDIGYDGKVAPRYNYDDQNIIEYGNVSRMFAKVLTPLTIGWIRCDVLVAA